MYNPFSLYKMTNFDELETLNNFVQLIDSIYSH